MCALMMGEQEALVIDVTPWDVHGVGYVDVTLALRDRTVEVARLGKESVPICVPEKKCWSARP